MCDSTHTHSSVSRQQFEFSLVQWQLLFLRVEWKGDVKRQSLTVDVSIPSAADICLLSHMAVVTQCYASLLAFSGGVAVRSHCCVSGAGSLVLVLIVSVKLQWYNHLCLVLHRGACLCWFDWRLFRCHKEAESWSGAKGQFQWVSIWSVLTVHTRDIGRGTGRLSTVVGQCR